MKVSAVALSRWPVLLSSIVASYVLIWMVNHWLFSSPWMMGLTRASGGWADPNLLLFVPMTLVVIGVIVLGWGRHELRDIGLGRSGLATGLAVLVAVWVLIQVSAVLAVLVAGESLQLNPTWVDPGAGFMLGFALAMVLGTALYEEAVFRGLLLPQLYLRLQWMRRERLRLVIAILLSSVVFALWHVPTLMINQNLSGLALLAQLASLTGAGIILSLLYLRTGNLYVVIAIHALVNAPTLLIVSPVNGSTLCGLFGLMLILFWPWLLGQPLRSSLMRFQTTASSSTARR